MLKTIITFKTLKYVILFGIIFLAFFVRFHNLDKHFSHVDDLIAPSIGTMTVDDIIKKVNEKNIQINEELIRDTYPYFKPLIVAYGIAKGSTYAPLQFVFTGAIIDNKMEYHKILFYSRLISFIVGFLSILLILYISLKFYGKDNIIYSILAVTILSLSWEHIIYSMQSESYTIGLFVVLLSFVIYIKYFFKENLNIKESFFLGSFLSLFILSSYQFLFFLPGFYIAIFLSYTNNYKKFISSYLLSIIIVIFTFGIEYFLFLSSSLSRGLNWNVGPNKEFMFNLYSQDSTLDYIFHFFSQNTYLVFRNLISFANEGNIINDLFAVIYIFMFLLGIFSFLISKNSLKKNFVVFFLVTVVIWVILIIFQKITLSPTRHSLILLSFILIFTPAGMIYLFEKINIQKFLIIFPIITIFIFLLNYKSVINQRIDKFNPTHIEQLITQYKVTGIYEYGWTRNLNFMTMVKDNFVESSINNMHAGETYFKHKTGKENNCILFITHRSLPLTNEMIQQYLEDINVEKKINFKIIYKEEHTSNTEICFGNRTKNGTNSMLLYIIKKG